MGIRDCSRRALSSRQRQSPAGPSKQEPGTHLDSRELLFGISQHAPEQQFVLGHGRRLTPVCPYSSPPPAPPLPAVLSPWRAGLGGNPLPKRDLHRFVKWPKYVRIQRQRRVLSMRLKVPPSLNQFVTRTLDKNQASTLFKLLLKYRPEDKKQKKDRLKAEAEARAAAGGKVREGGAG